MNNLACPQTSMIGNSGSMTQTQRDMIYRAPVFIRAYNSRRAIKLRFYRRRDRRENEEQNYTKNMTDPGSQIIITSIGVDTFVSLILSYFCFLFPAFSPCQGRLEKENVRKKDHTVNKVVITLNLLT